MIYYINKEDLQYFSYNGKVSTDFSILITKTNQLSSPERNIDVVEVDGKNGALLMDKGNYKPFELKLECSIDSENININQIASQIKIWLQGDFSYKKLILSDDEEYYYEAVVINKLDIEEVIKELGEFQVIFLCKPLKKVVGGENKIILKSNKIIYNNYMCSNPYIKVIGNGDTTISINNQELVLKGVEDEIEIDSEIMNAYKTANGEVILQNHKMYSEFPILEEGKNNISWIGDVERLEIVPRWVIL